MEDNLITIGLASIEIGDVGNDGGMGTTLEKWGYTQEDSCKFSQDAPDQTDFIPEEIDDPIYTSTKKKPAQVTFIIMDPGTEVLAAVTGGEVVSTGTAPDPIIKTFHAPSSAQKIEKSLKITAKEGLELEISRGLVSYSLDSPFGKNGLFTVTVTVKILQPKKVGESPWRARAI